MAVQTVHLKAPDISCGHCVRAITSRLSNLDGVSDVQASAETKLVAVTFDADAIDLDKIGAELADEGYPAVTN